MLKMCPKCGYFYDDTKYQQCPQCNAEVENIVSNSSVQNTNSNSQNKVQSNDSSDECVCKRCGGFAPYGNDYCPDCIVEMEQEEAQKIKQTIEEKSVSANEHQCPACGNIQSKNIARCLICGQIIDDGIDNTSVQNDEVNTNDQVQDNTSNFENEENVDSIQEESNENLSMDNGFNIGQNNQVTFNSDNSNSSNLTNNNSKTATKTNNFFVGNMKYIVAVVSVILIVALGAVAGASISSHKQREPIVINLDNYISTDVLTDNNYEDYGYSQNEDIDSFYSNTEFGSGLIILGASGDGSIDSNMMKNIINWDNLKSDINTQLEDKKRYDGRYLTFSDFFDENSFTYDVSNREYIKNGDTITVNVSPVQDTFSFNDTYIEINSTIQNYQISSMTEIYPFDPFDYVDVIRYDTGDIALKVPDTLDENYEGVDIRYYDDETIIIGNQENTTLISYWFVDGPWTTWVENLEPGDEVTMQCTDIPEELETGYHFSLVSSQKAYVY